MTLLAAAASAATLHVTVRNELSLARTSETIELPASSLAPLGNDLTRIHVFDGAKEVLAQSLTIDGVQSLIFQADIPANGSRTFDLRAGEPRVYKREDFRVYGRFVRERYDDFAWENDRIAHRMYGAALETWEKEPLTSSTVDVWIKRTKRLVVNDWYMVDDYHRDHGEGGDFYSAGRSRGCGGVGLWRPDSTSGGKLVVSKNFRDSRVLANGPIRLVFELVYPGFETKRVTLDAGQNLSHYESRFENAAGESYAAGIRKLANAQVRIERAAGWFRTWEPVKDGIGEFGCAVVLDPSSIADIAVADGNQVVIAHQPARYWAGAGWDKSGDFGGVADWDRYVDEWAKRVASPLRVQVTAE